MWIKTSATHVFSCHPAQVESITVRPIMHSENFGLFFKGRDDLPLDCGDLDEARRIMALITVALAEGINYLDLSEVLP